MLPSNSTAARVIARLEAMPKIDIRTRGANQYKMNSPLRAGSDSGDFTLTITDGEHGQYYDGPADKGGSLYELAQEIGVEAGARPLEPINTKRSYISLGDYAQAHGVPAEVFSAAGWEETVHNARPALRIPTASGDRWRYLDGEKPSYMNASGYEACWYGLARAVDMARRRGGAVVLCNGEASVVAAQHHGVAAAAITTGGERTLPDGLLTELRAAWSGPIAVALDCDTKGREAAPKLAQQLRRASYDAKPIDLGGAAGFDLADFCRLHESESYAVLCELARTEPRKSKIIHASDLKRLPPPEWLVRGWIVKRGLNIIYGAPGTGKSTRVLDWCCNLAQSARVLYVAAEDAGGYAPRHDGWCKFFKQDTPGLMFWPEEVNALDPANVEAFIQEVRPLGVDLVVFDTLTRCIPGGSDADAVAMGLFIAMCDRVRRECGAAALVVHHTGKNGEYRGHSSLLGAADMFVRFEDKDDLKITTVEKAKNSAPIEPLKERFVEVATSMRDAESGQPITTIVLVPDASVDPVHDRKMPAGQMKAMEVLCMRIFEGRGVSKQELGEATSLPRSSLYHTLSILRKRGYIEYISGKSSNLAPTSEGRAAFYRQYRGEQAPAPRAVPGYDEPENPIEDSASQSAIPIVQSLSNVESNSNPSQAESNSLPMHPLKGARGIGQLDSGVGNGNNDLDSASESNVQHWTNSGTLDMAFVERMLLIGDRAAIQRHCVMQRVDYAALMAQLESEAEE